MVEEPVVLVKDPVLLVWVIDTSVVVVALLVDHEDVSVSVSDEDIVSLVIVLDVLLVLVAVTV